MRARLSVVNFDRLLAASAVSAAVLLAAVASGDAALILGLAPAIALLVPLLVGFFPGEGAIEAAGRWLGEIGCPKVPGNHTSPLFCAPAFDRSRLDRAGPRTRGPPVAGTI